jgi:hypothetical protein
MGATERWVCGFNGDGLPIIHEENDGARFVRCDPEEREYPLHWHQTHGRLLKEAIEMLGDELKKKLPEDPAPFRALESTLSLLHSCSVQLSAVRSGSINGERIDDLLRVLHGGTDKNIISMG